MWSQKVVCVAMDCWDCDKCQEACDILITGLSQTDSNH